MNGSVRPSVRLSVCLSVRLSVTPFWLCSHHRIIMKFSGVITMVKSDVHAKGQRSKVKVTEVNTQLSRFRTLTPVWIHIWQWRYLFYATSSFVPISHDDVIKWKHFSRYWSFVRGIRRFPVNSPHKGQWRGALMFSLICVWINGWVNKREAGNLRHYRAHYDVTVMIGTI